METEQLTIPGVEPVAIITTSLYVHADGSTHGQVETRGAAGSLLGLVTTALWGPGQAEECHHECEWLLRQAFFEHAPTF